MPWCPKCRRFQEENDLCASCWVETVDQLEPEPDQPLEDVHEVLLATVTGENEANIIQGLLKVNDIISLRKHRGIGGYVQIATGTSAYGIDIFVLESEFEKAKDILAGYKDSLLDTEDVLFEEVGLNEDNNTNYEENSADAGENDEDSPLRLNRMIKLILVSCLIFLIFLLSRQSHFY